MSQRNLRKISAIFVAFLIALVVTYRDSKQPISSPQSNVPATQSTTTTDTFYPVTRVVDGDTLKVNKDGKVVTVRLIGLDTPELVDPRKPVQCFAKEASDEAKKILTGQFVRLETDPSQGTLDKYGRLLAYAYVNANSDPNGILVNEYMIAEGYGHEYTYNLPYKYQNEFRAAEIVAREQGKGLWAPGVCI